MSTLRAIGTGLFLLCAVFMNDQAAAQVPPHTPGTICFTPNFWCWAQPPGPPGRSCACRTSNGWVSGRLG